MDDSVLTLRLSHPVNDNYSLEEVVIGNRSKVIQDMIVEYNSINNAIIKGKVGKFIDSTSKAASNIWKFISNPNNQNTLMQLGQIYSKLTEGTNLNKDDIRQIETVMGRRITDNESIVSLRFGPIEYKRRRQDSDDVPLLDYSPG